jgi:hypothetical protein
VIVADTATERDDWPQVRAALELLLLKPRALPTTFGLVDVGERATQVIAPTTVGPEGFTGSLELLRALLAEPAWYGPGRRLGAGFATAATTNPGRDAQILITDGASTEPDPTEAEVGVPTYVIGLGVGATTGDGQRLERLARASRGEFFGDVGAAELPRVMSAIDAAIACEVPVPATVTDISPLGTIVGPAQAGGTAQTPIVGLPPGGSATVASVPVPAPHGVTLAVTGTWRDRAARFAVRSVDLVRGDGSKIHVPLRILRRAVARAGVSYRSIRVRARAGGTFFAVRLRVPAAVVGGAQAQAAQTSTAHGASLGMDTDIYRPKKPKKPKRPKRGHGRAAAASDPGTSAARRLVAVRITRSTSRRPRPSTAGPRSSRSSSSSRSSR